jgi:predicted RNase H-like HicB family nuclease
VTPKRAALQAIEALPDDCTWEDVLKELRGHADIALPTSPETLVPGEAALGHTVEQPAVDNAQEGVMSRTYDVVVERDEEGYFVASVPGLHGCHTQASTLEQVLERIREAIELCLEVSDSNATQFIGIRQVTVAA